MTVFVTVTVTVTVSAGAGPCRRRPAQRDMPPPARARARIMRRLAHGRPAQRRWRRIGEDNRVTMTEPPPAAPPSAAANPVNTAALRLSRTPMDMTKAVLVLLVPVIIAVAVYVFFFGGSNPIVIDPSGTYSEAQAAHVFTVVQPQGLSSGWRPVSSTFGVENGRHVLRVGYVTPDGAGIQLVESDGSAAAAISDVVGTANPVGSSVQLGDRTWGEVGAGKNDQRALIDTATGYTVIVKGQASEKDLRTFASSLR